MSPCPLATAHGANLLVLQKHIKQKNKFLQTSTGTFVSLKTPRAAGTEVYIEFDSFLEKGYV